MGPPPEGGGVGDHFLSDEGHFPIRKRISFFFSLYSHRFKVFVTRILRFVFSAAEYSRIHCILKNTLTHRIHTEYTTCSALRAIHVITSQQ